MNGVPPYSPHSYGFVRQSEAPAELPELSRLDAELLPELHRVLYRRRSEARALEQLQRLQAGGADPSADDVHREVEPETAKSRWEAPSCVIS